MSDSWIGPAPLPLDADGFSSIFTEAGFGQTAFFAQLRNATQWSGMFPLFHPAENSTLRRPLRITFVGDSIADEMAHSCSLLSPLWKCDYVRKHTLCRASFVHPDCSTFEEELRGHMRSSDIVVLSQGMHFLIPSAIGDPSTSVRLRHNQPGNEDYKKEYAAASGGDAPARMYDRQWRELLEVVSRVAPAPTARRAIVVCTPMGLDTSMIFGDPWKQDWDRFYDYQLGAMWADRAEAVARSMRVARPGLLVLPLSRLARRYKMMRCDGMHFSSYTCERPPHDAAASPALSKSEFCKSGNAQRGRFTLEGQTGAIPETNLACHPKLGAYHGLLITAFAAAQHGRTLEEQIKNGKRLGSWVPEALVVAPPASPPAKSRPKMWTSVWDKINMVWIHATEYD